MRVRGLKQKYGCKVDPGKVSHPMRVRGLKLRIIANQLKNKGRTPCGCVD